MNLKSKLTVLTLLAISFSIFRVNAQVYHPFPTGSATWKVVRCSYFLASGWHDEYTFNMDGSDTIHAGITFKKITISEHALHGSAFDSIYPTTFFGGITKVNKQIFIWRTWANAAADSVVTLIYDFNSTTVGDTIYTNANTGNPNPFGHVILSVDSVQIGSQYHKRLYLQDPLSIYNTEYWIEGVGSSWGMPFATYWSSTDNSYDLTCYYESQQLKYNNPAPGYSFCTGPLPVISCDSALSTGQTLISTINITVSPNPTSEKININGVDEIGIIAEITNTVGQRILMARNQKQIDVSNLSRGIYFVKVTYGEKFTVTKFIKQ